eukprot:9649221-Alexandrium_andersonii.AAC.1
MAKRCQGQTQKEPPMRGQHDQQEPVRPQPPLLELATPTKRLARKALGQACAPIWPHLCWPGSAL